MAVHPAEQRTLWIRERGKSHLPLCGFWSFAQWQGKQLIAEAMQLEPFRRWMSKTMSLCISEDARMCLPDCSCFAHCYICSNCKRWSQFCYAGQLGSCSIQWHLLVPSWAECLPRAVEPSPGGTTNGVADKVPGFSHKASAVHSLYVFQQSADLFRASVSFSIKWIQKYPLYNYCRPAWGSCGIEMYINYYDLR